MHYATQKDMEVIDGDLIISLALNYKSIDINYSYQLSDPILIHINRSINENQIKKMAIIGLNNRLPFILEELSKTKIKLDILSSANSNFFEEWLKKNCEGMTFNKKSINYSQCSFYYEDEIIEKLKLSDYDKIVVLADEDSDENNYSDITKIDSDTLFKLLKIINIKQKMYATLDFKLISEIVDPESEEVVNKIPSHLGYVVGTLITSKILNMTFVNNNIINVFNHLIQRGGVDISTGNFYNS